jgi:hypothetical protein
MQDSERHLWQRWSDSLQQWGVNEVAATILDSAGPFTVILAQVVYAGSSLAGTRRDSWLFLAQTLEDPLATRQFTQILRGQSA